MEEGDSAALGIQARNRRVREGLIRARRHLGIHVRADFARLMDAANNHEGPDESTYNRWEHEVEDEEEGKRGRIIPGWALDVAAEVAGVSVDYLLGGELTPAVERRLEAVETRLEGVLAQLKELQRQRRVERSERRRQGRPSAANG